MKSFIKSLSIALIAALISVIIYDQYFNNLYDIPNNNLKNTVLIPTNYKVHTNSIAGEKTDFTIAASKTIDAVVHVKNTSSSSSNLPSFYRYFYDEDELPERIGTGSGVIVSPDGYIITNNHVIEDSNEIEITTNDNKSYQAKIIGTDPDTDIAVLKINSNKKLPYVFWNSDATQIGEWVLAVGNPLTLIRLLQPEL